MAESNEPKAADYYALLGLPNHATPASIEQALAKEETRFDDTRSPSDVRKGEAHGLLQRKLNEARMILLDEEKRELYDGIHSSIAVLWSDHHKGLRSTAADAILAEHINRMILSDEPTVPRSRLDMLLTGGNTRMTSKGPGGCLACFEDEKDQTLTYKYCTDCSHGMHETC